MKEFKCKKCESKDLFTKESGTNVGLYCADCGKWIQWLGKQDRILFKEFESRQLQEKIKDGIDDFISRTEETILPFGGVKLSIEQIQINELIKRVDLLEEVVKELIETK